jgi:dienelactone hydrolase
VGDLQAPAHAADRSRALRLKAALAALVLLAGCASNLTSAPDDVPLDPQLHETVVMLPGAPDRPVELQVTLFRPEGPGPFPLAVLVHGLERGQVRSRERWRAPYASRYFLSRGYMVALPMARGVAGSGGTFDSKGCDVEADGIDKAQDLRGVIQALRQDARVDPSRIVVLGQSYGGLATLALGTLDVPDGVKALVNFAGGRRARYCSAYAADLVAAMASYGRRTTVPSIWFYGDNDSVFPPAVWRPMFEAYRAHGGRATLVEVGHFAVDAHRYLADPDGLASWAPKLDAFLTTTGLPTAITQPALLGADPAPRSR